MGLRTETGNARPPKGTALDYSGDSPTDSDWGANLLHLDSGSSIVSVFLCPTFRSSGPRSDAPQTPTFPPRSIFQTVPWVRYVTSPVSGIHSFTSGHPDAAQGQ